MIGTLLKFLVIAIVTIPIALVEIFVSLVDRSGKSFHVVGRFWSWIILTLYGIRVSVEGTEHLDPSKRYIYVSNHASMFDIPAVLTGIPDEIRIVMKKELTRIPFFGWAMAVGPYIVIDRFHAKDAVKGLERAAERIRNGASVFLFAEGTRTLDGKLQPFKRGAFALASKSGVPIIPVAINNTFGILPKGSKVVRPAHITVVLDRPIPTEGVEGKQGEMKLMEEVHRAIAKNYIDQS
ncbi:MAG: 1-acyl-sn-glycerol-3-phosphate acyltransferase [Ignavibacteriales bacterium]|nr:1-acyl-sn-glycerol-3-phosphate acyltransferase [Ignavibacteriales bacterium]